MFCKKHIIITGTGRSGTTFLIELLTHLKFDTGFSVNDLKMKKDVIARAGLEHDIRKKDSPYIVKSPWFCDYAEEVLNREDIIIDQILIPIRDIKAAAESRRYVERVNTSKLSFSRRMKHKIKPLAFAGGLWHTDSIKENDQEEILQRQIYRLILAVSKTSLPIIFMQFPMIIKDCRYLYEKLKPILQDISYDAFHTVFKKTVNYELVHCFNKNDC